MATVVTAAAAVSLTHAALPTRVEIGGEPFPEILPLTLKTGRGRNPGSLTMKLPFDLLYRLNRSSAPGVWRPGGNLDNTGWQPAGIAPLAVVDLKAVEGENEQVMFRGWITGWRPSEGESAEIIALDARWRMTRLFVYGQAFYDDGGVEQQGRFTRPADVVFNRKNQPDMWCGPFGVPGSYNGMIRYLFLRPWVNTIDGFTLEDSEDFIMSRWWQAPHIYGYLRQIFSTAAGFGASVSMPAVDDWLVLPEVGDTPLADKVEEAIVSEQDFTGKTLSEALDKVCEFASDVSWTVEPHQDEGKQKVVFYDSKEGNASMSFARGEVGAKIQTARPTVGRVGIGRNYQGVATRAVALGGRHRLMLTFSTEDGTLVVGWLSAEQAAWLAQADEDKKNSTQYPNVFLKWVVPYSFPWDDYSDETCAMQKSLKFLPVLLEKWVNALNQGGGAVSLPAQIWRKVSGTWELLPDGISARVLPDEGGFLLAGNARSLDTGKPWTWDESAETAYPMRITAVVELDERLIAEDEVAGPFALDQLVRVQGRVKEDAYSAKVHLTGEGDGSEVTRTQNYRDDTDALASAAEKLGRVVHFPRSQGPLEWDYVNRAVKVGTKVPTLYGGGPTRPTINLNGVIHGLQIEFNPGQKTVAEVEAL